MNMFLKLWILAICFYSNLASSSSDICNDFTRKLKNNGCTGICKGSDLKLINNRYDGVIIAINPNVLEDLKIIEKLKVSFFKGL